MQTSFHGLRHYNKLDPGITFLTTFKYKRHSYCIFNICFQCNITLCEFLENVELYKYLYK